MKFALRDEREELDRRIDMVNVVFGAALGGYIGVVMTRRDLDVDKGLVLTTTLVIVVCLLVAIRNLVHLLRGTRSGSWKVPVTTLIVGIAFFAFIRGDTYLDLSVLLPVVLGWVFAFIVVIASHVIMCRDTEH